MSAGRSAADRPGCCGRCCRPWRSRRRPPAPLAARESGASAGVPAHDPDADRAGRAARGRPHLPLRPGVRPHRGDPPHGPRRIAVSYHRYAPVPDECGRPALGSGLRVSRDGGRTWHEAAGQPWAGSGRVPNWHATIAWGPGPRARPGPPLLGGHHAVGLRLQRPSALDRLVGRRGRHLVAAVRARRACRPRARAAIPTSPWIATRPARTTAWSTRPSTGSPAPAPSLASGCWRRPTTGRTWDAVEVPPIPAPDGYPVRLPHRPAAAACPRRRAHRGVAPDRCHRCGPGLDRPGRVRGDPHPLPPSPRPIRGAAATATPCDGHQRRLHRHPARARHDRRPAAATALDRGTGRGPSLGSRARGTRRLDVTPPARPGPGRDPGRALRRWRPHVALDHDPPGCRRCAAGPSRPIAVARDRRGPRGGGPPRHRGRAVWDAARSRAGHHRRVGRDLLDGGETFGGALEPSCADGGTSRRSRASAIARGCATGWRRPRMARSCGHSPTAEDAGRCGAPDRGHAHRGGRARRRPDRCRIRGSPETARPGLDADCGPRAQHLLERPVEHRRQRAGERRGEVVVVAVADDAVRRDRAGRAGRRGPA